MLHVATYIGKLVLWLTSVFVAPPWTSHFWSGVQQGDPLGPLFFALVLHKVSAAIDADDDCHRFVLQAWYLDDGVLAGPEQAVLRALSIIEDLGPSLGISSFYPNVNSSAIVISPCSLLS